MAATKAQLAVWGLISGLSVWGYAMLSRVKLPEEVATTLPPALVAVATPQALEPARTATPTAKALPAMVPVFPFPDDLIPAVAEASEVAQPVVVGAFAAIPSDAVPVISAIDGEPAGLVAAAEPASAPAAEPEAVAVASVATEEPPIPRPSRPLVAQPVKAVPLAEVKTLYVAADALNVRAIPSTNGPVLQKLPQGFAVAAREQADEWIGFVMRNGQTGWMRTEYLSETMPPASPPSSAAPPSGNEPLNLMM